MALENRNKVILEMPGSIYGKIYIDLMLSFKSSAHRYLLTTSKVFSLVQNLKLLRCRNVVV